MGSKTDYLENKLLDHTVRNTLYTQAATVYTALFTATPSDAGGGTEVTQATSGYTRQATAFITAASGSTNNSGAITFATAGGSGYGAVTHWALFDAGTSGNMLYWSTLTATVTINAGDQAVFATGGIVISED